MRERIHAWVSRQKRRRARPGQPRERASGEEAIGTTAGVTAEATPSGMPRVKTERL